MITTGKIFTMDRGKLFFLIRQKAAALFILIIFLQFFSMPFLFSESIKEIVNEEKTIVQGIFRNAAAVVIDPGHGGKDPGAVFTFQDNGSNITVYEKDINLAISRMVKEELENTFPELTISMTRTDDNFVSLWKRAETANKLEIDNHKSKVFISIHANAAVGSSAKGFEVWIYKQNTDGEEKKFAESTVSETFISNLVADLNNRLTEELVIETQFLADKILNSLDDDIGDITYNRGVKEANFYILKETFMPAILVETGFITNYEEVQNLISPEYQKRISSSICEGLKNYINDQPYKQQEAPETTEK